jgi:putative Holliday junction resolvase
MIHETIESFIKEVGKTGKLMGIDAGRVNIGIAVSDFGRLIATPKTTIKRKSNAIDFPIFQDLMKQNQIVGIVMGLPLNALKQETESSKYIKRLTESLNEFLEKQNTPTHIIYHDEAMSSKEAEEMLIETFDISRQKRKKIIDKVASGYILQNFLDKLN